MIYLFLLIVFSIPVFFKDKLPFFEKPYWYWGECILLILVAGLRLVVGGDTQTYMMDFDTYPTLDELSIFHFAIFRYQPLWILFNCAAKTIYPEFFVVQIILACIINPIAFYIIKKETEKKYEVAILYLLFQFLYFNCEIMRDSISICLFYFAFDFYIKRKWISYYAISFLAFLFHDAALFYFIMPFFYPIINKEFTPKYALMISVFMLVFTNPIILSKLLFFLPEGRIDSFKEAYSTMEIGSVLGIIRGVIDVLLVYYIIVVVRGKVSYKVYTGLKMFFVLHIMGLVMPIFSSRVSNCFTLFYYISWVEFLYIMRNKIVTSIYCVFMCITFTRTYFLDVTSQVVSKPSSDRYYFYERYYPYYSIFETPSNEVISRRREIYNNSMEVSE